MLVKKLKYQLSNLSKIRQLVSGRFGGQSISSDNKKQVEQPRSYIFHETFKTTTTV